MASDEEKNAIIALTGDYRSVEWPWNKLYIAKERNEALEIINHMGIESAAFIVSMMIFHQLIIKELVHIHGSSGYYDSLDEGKLSAVLLVTDNFVQNPKKETAIILHNLIMELDEDIYVPGLSECMDLENNIHSDVWFIHSFLDDWRTTSGHENPY